MEACEKAETNPKKAREKNPRDKGKALSHIRGNTGHVWLVQKVLKRFLLSRTEVERQAGALINFSELEGAVHSADREKYSRTDTIPRSIPAWGQSTWFGFCTTSKINSH